MNKESLNYVTPGMQYERPEALDGRTYKIKAPNQEGKEQNIYLTINHHESEGYPIEVFINCSDAKLYEWFSSKMVFWSRLLRERMPLTVIAEDLESIESPSTGHWQRGTFYPSTLAHLGAVVRQHHEALMAAVDRSQDEDTEAEA